MAVRLHHPHYANAVLVVETPKPLHAVQTNVPRDCPECGKQHTSKSLHIRLDAHGDGMTSDQAWLRHEQSLRLAGLEPANEVTAPPTLYVGAVEAPQRQIVEVRINHDQAASPFYQPEKSRHESQKAVDASLAPLRDAAAEQKDRAATKAKAAKSSTFVMGRSK